MNELIAAGKKFVPDEDIADKNDKIYAKAICEVLSHCLSEDGIEVSDNLEIIFVKTYEHEGKPLWDKPFDPDMYIPAIAFIGKTDEMRKWKPTIEKIKFYFSMEQHLGMKCRDNEERYIFVISGSLKWHEVDFWNTANGKELMSWIKT